MRRLLGVVLVLAVAMGVKTMVFGDANEELPAPLLDEAEDGGAYGDGGVCRRMLLGRADDVPADKGRDGKTWAGYSGGTKETANYGAVSSERRSMRRA